MTPKPKNNPTNPDNPDHVIKRSHTGNQTHLIRGSAEVKSQHRKTHRKKNAQKSAQYQLQLLGMGSSRGSNFFVWVFNSLLLGLCISFLCLIPQAYEKHQLDGPSIQQTDSCTGVQFQVLLTVYYLSDNVHKTILPTLILQSGLS